MRKIASLFAKDVLLGIKDIFILLEIGFAVVIAIFLVFVVPDDITTETPVYIYDATGFAERIVDEMASRMDGELDEAVVGDVFVSSRGEVVAGMRENRTALGVTIGRTADGRFDVELLTQPYTTRALVEYVEAEMRDLFAVISQDAGYPRPVLEAVRIESLQEGLRDEIPFNERVVPVVLLVMVGVIGLFAMVSLLGQERSDKTIRALRVSPTGLTAVLVSKHLTLLATGVLTFSIIYIPTVGLGGYLPALAVMVLTILIGSSLGTFLGTFFDDPMSAIGAVFILLVVLSLPGISLLAPVFSPDWLRLIPSYHTLFGLDAAIFPDNNTHVIWQSALALAGFALVLIPVSGWVYTVRTRKEA